MKFKAYRTTCIYLYLYDGNDKMDYRIKCVPVLHIASHSLTFVHTYAQNVSVKSINVIELERKHAKII